MCPDHPATCHEYEHVCLYMYMFVCFVTTLSSAVTMNTLRGNVSEVIQGKVLGPYKLYTKPI